MVTIALPKGRLTEEATELFKDLLLFPLIFLKRQGNLYLRTHVVIFDF